MPRISLSYLHVPWVQIAIASLPGSKTIKVKVPTTNVLNIKLINLLLLVKVFQLTGMDPENRTDPMEQVFPQMGKCTFKLYGPSGSVEQRDVMCLLPTNVANEKVKEIASGLIVPMRGKRDSQCINCAIEKVKEIASGLLVPMRR